MDDEADPYLWLEDVTGEAALDWVRERNARTEARFTTDDGFAELRASLLEVLDTDARIPWPRPRGEHLYNVWRDAAHPRGVWRRTTRESFAAAGTSGTGWDVLLDLDAVAAAEDESWVWGGAVVLRPEQDRALVTLSRGGSDAAVVREYSITDRAWVADGFVLPEAKSDVGWVDADTVLVGTDLGEGSLTTSGYPRTVRRWRRGTPVADAPVVFAGEATDVAVSGWHDRTPGFERTFVARATDFYNSELSILTDTGPEAGGTPVRLDVPTDADTAVHREWLTVRLTTDWEVGGTTHPAGALLATHLETFLAGDRTFHTVFTPGDRTALHQHTWTEHHLLLVVLDDVRPSVHVATPGPDGFTVTPVEGLPELVSLEVVGTDPLPAADGGSGDEYLLSASGYLTPPTLQRGVAGGERPVVLASAPALFDATGLEVTQHHATSLDGTQVPYVVVGRPGSEPGPGPGPTLLYGYGGFEVSLLPAYSAVRGRAWLERGGTYVVANLRGGGELGPGWHTQVLGAGRHRVHEDVAAVARDLVARGVSTPDRLGVQGGSNGGLLTGIVATKYPELVGAVVCQVPLLDMRRYHLLLAGASWMAEYGDPDDPEQWAHIAEYSPYQNARPGTAYPPLLVTTSTRDDRVHPGHARKFVARLESQGADVSYFENIEGGHGGAADNAQLAFTNALAHRFLWSVLDPGRG
ncbi:prolyl oligopeptidase family serine peptidase [Rhodococcus aerolatus]